MSHFSSAPRKDFATIHHTSGRSHHNVTDCRFCDSGYDFTVFRDGRFCTCRDSVTGEERWRLRVRSGETWHAAGCDCRSIGIGLHGRFQESWGWWPTRMHINQACTIAYLMNHVGIFRTRQRIRPHAECATWDSSDPCPHPCPTRTVCPGWTYIENQGTRSIRCNGSWITADVRRWNTVGHNMTVQINDMRANWSSDCAWRY